MMIKCPIRHSLVAGGLCLVCFALPGCAGTDWHHGPVLSVPQPLPEATVTCWVGIPRHEICPLAPPPEGYRWDVLARMAAMNCAQAGALFLEARVDYERAATDGAWRSPQLRLGHQESDADRDSNDAGLRIYTANPFVGHWRRRVGMASANAKEAEAGEEAYAVFCEVRALCLDAELLREERVLIEDRITLRRQFLDLCEEQARVGVISPVTVIRTRTQLTALQAENREKQVARQRLIRRIALLTGLPAERVNVRPRGSEEPISVRWLEPSVLTELAFLRRPDLATAEQEREAAEYGVREAQAEQFPWLEYFEGTYEDESSDGTWEQRAAVVLPVANWLGDDVRLSRRQLYAAETRENRLREQVQAEVTGVLEDYLKTRVEHDRLTNERNEFCRTIAARLDTLSGEKAIQPGEILSAREDLLAYQQTCLKAEGEFLRLAQYLEAVSGGPLSMENKEDVSQPIGAGLNTEVDPE